MNLDYENSVSIELIPIESINIKPQKATGTKSDKIINRVCENIQLYCDLDKKVIQFSLN
jgi:hypothetical protein